MIKKVFAACLIGAIAGLSACRNRPADAQLEEWRQEAIARNAELVKDRANQATEQEWQLLVQGSTKSGETVRLRWPQLKALAVTRLQTRLPFKTSEIEGIVDFRGILVSTLLDKFVAGEDSEVTFIASNAYRATVNVADLRRYPIALAIEKNGRLLSRSEGGPLFLVFPSEKYPELKQKYPEGYWVFYVTHLIIGTEPVLLRVGGRSLDAAALDKLPQVTFEEGVGYSLGWPNGPVKLSGVRVRDVLSAADVKLPANGAVLVRGKALSDRDDAKPILLEAERVLKCDVMLATRWGRDRQPIPAKMGGPVTLAFPSTCKGAAGDRELPNPQKQPWVTFVEELEVTAP